MYACLYVSLFASNIKGTPMTFEYVWLESGKNAFLFKFSANWQTKPGGRENKWHRILLGQYILRPNLHGKKFYKSFVTNLFPYSD
jgi:hypothetical protein